MSEPKVASKRSLPFLPLLTWLVAFTCTLSNPCLATEGPNWASFVTPNAEWRVDDIEIRSGGSHWATIREDGTIRIDGRSVGQVRDDGSVRRSGSGVGEIRSNGTIRRGGRSIGEVRSDGTIRLDGSSVGRINSSGSIRIDGSTWGTASNCSGFDEYRKVVAVLIFFSDVLE